MGLFRLRFCLFLFAVLVFYSAGWSSTKSTASSPPKTLMWIDAKMLQFSYQSLDGGVIIRCTHALANRDNQDWEVKCPDPMQRADRKYIVHLWITGYTHPVPQPKDPEMGPELTYEILYWVTDWSDPAKPVNSGTTLWFHLKKFSEMMALQMNLSVEDDRARLRMELDPSGLDPSPRPNDFFAVN